MFTLCSNTGQAAYIASCIKWFTDYFIAAHTAATTLVGQIGDGNLDHSWWGRAEQMTMSRPAFSITAGAPGSDLAGETAAALAAASIYFKAMGNSSYAATCLTHAQQLLDFAVNYQETSVSELDTSLLVIDLAHLDPGPG
jgi:endoglucanase